MKKLAVELFVAAPLLVAWHSCVVWFLWNWYVPPIVGGSLISYGQAIGIAALLMVVFRRTYFAPVDEAENMIRGIDAVGTPGIALAAGAIGHYAL